MVKQRNSTKKAYEPQVYLDSVISEQTKAMASAFANSSQSFLAEVQSLRTTLEGHIVEYYHTGSATPILAAMFHLTTESRRLHTSGSVLHKGYYWDVRTPFSYSSFVRSASEVYDAWCVAKRENKELVAFKGKTIQRLVQLFKTMGTAQTLKLTTASDFPGDAARLFLEFRTDVEQLELLLQLKQQKQQAASQKSDSSRASSVSKGAKPKKMTPQPQSSQNKTGAVSDADRKKVKLAIEEHRKSFNGGDPTGDAIRQRSGLGTGKIKKIMDERRDAGEWAVPKRNRKTT